MPGVAPEDEVKAGDEWVEYMDLDISQIDQRAELIIFGKASLRRQRQLIIPLLSYQKY